MVAKDAIYATGDIEGINNRNKLHGSKSINIITNTIRKKIAVLALFTSLGASFFNPLFSQETTVAPQTTQRTVEDGGTGPYPALMLTERSSLSFVSMANERDFYL